MPLSWNEIRHRAIEFANNWQDETRERGEAQSFWNDFYNIFGIKRRTVASFEEPVKKLSGDWSFIDLFWPGKMLAEHKSAGQSLSKAHSQGMEYIRSLKDSGRDKEIPRYIIVSDFARIALHDLEPEQDPNLPLLKSKSSIEFPISELHKNVRHFAFIAGYQQRRLDPEDPANEEAVNLLCDLHDTLEAGGYRGHDLKRFLVRILFCLFADDTGIFPPDAFKLWLQDHTAEDGSDLGSQLDHFFRILNTPDEKRQQNLEEDLRQFPYVNGELFSERLEFADFNSDMRNCLLACCQFHWDRISPAVFGSLFQSVMEPKERRQIGAHYTAEKNILKLIRSLFLDDLCSEFKTIKADRSTRRSARLEEFQKKIAKLRFLDPACGCGNFLVISYRELRLLELEVLLERHGGQHEMALDEVNKLSWLDVDHFAGIEIEEFPARIAEVALWLTDHQMNQRVGMAFSQNYQRIPLRKNPYIVVNNALKIDWNTVLSAKECTHILGNPPFVGAKYQTSDQRSDMFAAAGAVKNIGLLDYVTGWYFKAAEYMKGTTIRVAFVSTNSISQGEQPGILWSELFGRYHLKIQFAHRTFPWNSEARGKAHVHVVIIGFGVEDIPEKRIYDYEVYTNNNISREGLTSKDEHVSISINRNISPYLVEGPDRAIVNRERPLCDVPDISIGNKPIDDGNYLFTPEEKIEFLKIEPQAQEFFHRWLGAEEFINSIERWCLWLGDCSPDKLRQMPESMKRIDAVRIFRLASKSAPTQKLSDTPTRFHVENLPRKSFLLIPKVSSERRRYIPMGFISPPTMASDLVFLLPNANLFHFGILSSMIHMAWVRHIGGRLKSDYRYSAKLVYNNFPWPEEIKDKQKRKIETAAQAVLDARAQFPVSALSDLYDPVSMPPVLSKAHSILDKTVDRAYRKEPFHSDRERVEFLFSLYEKLTAPLVVTVTRVKRARQKKQKGLF